MHPAAPIPGAPPGPLPAWPYGVLDVPALRAAGWRPTPFRDVVLKVHQRCNLACDYCYVYTMADQSWRDRPRVMTPAVWRAAAARIAGHARAHGLTRMRLVLHGGEPLLAGPRRLTAMVADLREALPPACRAEITLQTNGTLLDAAALGVLREQGVTVGVSLDGAPADHDRRRRHPDGAGSSTAVHRALRLLADPAHRPSYAGLLCTVDLRADPVACYTALLRHRPPALDLLLPHATWAAPPPPAPDGGPAPYGRWLAAVFDRWYGAPVQETRIRLFEDIVSLVLGGPGRSEQVGLSPVGVVVIETDGAIEQVDALKSTYPGACATGLSVLRDDLDAAFDHPGVVARQLGPAALSRTCRSCPVHEICGGGHYVHRYRPGSGFRNPSVYCADLRELIEHVRGRVRADLGGG